MKIIKWLLLILAGVLVVGVGTLLAMGARANANTMRSSIEIARPPAQVWPWITEPEKLQAWISWTVEARRIDDKHLVMVMEDANSGGARIELHDEVIEMDAPRKLVIRLSSAGMFAGESRYTLTDLGGKTRLDSVFTYRYDHWLARLFEPLITPEAEKKQIGDFSRLKEAVEREH